MFYTFGQNNSGGSFAYDDKAGISEYVIVEAINRDQASAKAQDIGVYFGGVQDGQDCWCCGDRWSDYADEEKTPAIYGRPVAEGGLFNRWRENGPSVYVHYLDGTMKGYPKAAP